MKLTSPGMDYRIPAEGWVQVGRGGRNHIVVRDGSVSLVHCLFEMSTDGLLVRDTGSLNGTYLAGELVPFGFKAKVDVGDTIRLGRYEMEVKV